MGKKGVNPIGKKGVLTNASTDQTTIQYYIRLEEYSMDMVDYIVSISINPEITKSRMDKEKKQFKMN